MSHIQKRAGLTRAFVAVVLACVLSAGLVPAQAFAYYNRGAVGVALGSQSVEVAAGQTMNVTVSVTPASDEQTEGCGMPKCPQGCSASCSDENGQCGCAGKEYQTYYPSAVATSSDSSVAVATVSGNTLTVYGKKAGEATITVRASLRQFTDGQATVSVKVTGAADGQSANSAAFVDVPEVAVAEQADKADVVDKTVMGRAIHMVRIGDSLDAQAHLAQLAGVDGDVTFWSGDTYYHPEYSLTFKGTECDAGSLFPFSAALNVTTQAEGKLYQALSGKDCFVVVDFAQQGALPAQATVYAQANGAIDDDKDVALFSYDETAKSFVREDAQAAMVGGYASFTVSEGKTYVVSCRDLTAEANTVITGGASDANGAGSCCDPAGMDSMGADHGTQAMDSQALPPFVLVVIAVVVAAAAGAGVAVVVMRKRKPTAPQADASDSGKE